MDQHDWQIMKIREARKILADSRERAESRERRLREKSRQQ